MARLSAVIITYNEEPNIRRCLESVAGICDEIVVVDSGSVDNTVEICKSMGAVVIHQPFLGYIEQRNFAVSKAKNDWVLALDADEALTPELKSSIANAMAHPQADGYSMNRLTNYSGAWIRHGGWYPDVKLRLVNRQKGEFAGTNPHDRFKPALGAVIKHLHGDLLHYSFENMSEYIRQMDRFSAIGAMSMYNKGKRSNLAKILYKPLARFFKIYIFKAGFRDGLIGLTIAVNSSHAVFLKYLRLYFLEKDKKL